MKNNHNQRATLILEGENRTFHFDTFDRCAEVLDATCQYSEISSDLLLFKMMKSFLQFCADHMSGTVNDQLLQASSTLYQLAVKGFPVTCCECGAESRVSDPRYAYTHPTLCPDCYEMLTDQYGDGEEFVKQILRRYGAEKKEV